MSAKTRTIEQLLQALQVTVAFGVETGRAPAVAADLAANRKYFARSGTRVQTITRDEMEVLRGAGAPGQDVGVLRSFQNAARTTFRIAARAAGDGSISAVPSMRASASVVRPTGSFSIYRPKIGLCAKCAAWTVALR